MSKFSMFARTLVLASAATAALVSAGATTAVAASPNSAVGFNASAISGFPTGSVRLTGGGAFDSSSGSTHLGGGFDCTLAVDQGPLAGCGQGEGVRWDSDTLLRSTAFKCTGSAAEALKSASTSPDTAVLRADFYRAGDGNDESFSANMIVASQDIAPDIPGVQNVWVQGVGCATGTVNIAA